MGSFNRVSLIGSIVIGCTVALHASAISLFSPGGDHTVDGGLSLVVDPYGAFGSAASPAGNAIFNPPGAVSWGGTTYQSAVFIRGAGQSTFLADGDIGGSGNLPSTGLFTSTSDSSATSQFTRGDLSFSLTQQIRDRFDAAGQKSGSVLIQEYVITNTSTTNAADFSLTRYLDGDLYMADGTLADKGGASTLDRTMNQQLFEFDAGQNAATATTLTAIRAIGGSVPEHYFEVDSYSGLRSRIVNGTPLDNSIQGDGSDTDLVTDGAYDITLALQRDFSVSADEPHNLIMSNTVNYTTVTDFGLGTTGETPIEEIAPQERTRDMDGPGFNPDQGPGRYELEFRDTQELVVSLNIFLTGDAPIGPGGEDMRAIWEQGIESTWNGQYEVIDGINRYPISLDVTWVATAAESDFPAVTVTAGDGRVHSLNFFTGNPSGWGFENQPIIAAHEAGHWLGLLDEYSPMNDPDGPGPLTGQPAFWPLVDQNGNILIFEDHGENGWWELYDGVIGSPIANWATLNDLAFQGGLMGSSGEVQDWYYQAFVDWLADGSGRDLVLGMAPTFTTRAPMGIPDAPLGQSSPVPEPTSMILVSIGIMGLGAVRRRLSA